MVNGQVNLMSTANEDHLTQVEKQNNALGNMMDEVQSSAMHIFNEVDSNNAFIRRHSKAIEQNDESMSTSAKLTSTALSDLDKLWWNRQKQFC